MANRKSPLVAESSGNQEAGLGNETTIAVGTHVLGLLTLFVGPLIMYFIFKKGASPWLRAHLDEAVNYHILLAVAFVLLVVILAFTAKWTAAITILALLLLLIVIIHVVFSTLAIVWAARGKSFHFPLDIQMIK